MYILQMHWECQSLWRGLSGGGRCIKKRDAGEYKRSILKYTQGRCGNRRVVIVRGGFEVSFA